MSIILGFTEFEGTTFVFVAICPLQYFGSDNEGHYGVKCMTMDFWKKTVVGFISRHFYNYEDLADGYDYRLNDLRTLVADNKPFWRKVHLSVMRQQSMWKRLEEWEKSSGVTIVDPAQSVTICD